MVALDKRVILIALHAREGVVHVAVACLVSSHVQDEISHASILQPDSTLKTRPCNCTLVQALDAMQFYDCILRKQPASKCVRPLSSTMIDHAASKVLRGTCSIELSAQPHLISKGHKVCRSAWCNGPREGEGMHLAHFPILLGNVRDPLVLPVRQTARVDLLNAVRVCAAIGALSSALSAGICA